MLKGSTYTTFLPMMTSSSFDFRVHLENIFALEPPLKLATFVVEEVIFQNVKKKVKKIFPCRCNRRRRKRGLKTGNFFKIDIFHIQIYKKYVQGFFSHSKTSNDNLRNKLRFLGQF
jgi:hypothetical protein